MCKSNMSTINKKLSEELDMAIGNDSITLFANKCKLVDNKILIDMVKGKLQTLPPRELLRKIADNSKGRVTYRKLYDVCGYSDRDEEEDKTWSTYLVERGDVFYIDLGFNIDSEQSGIRPCLILQNDIGNKFSGTIVILPISTKLKNFGKTHVELTVADGVRETSYILSEQIRCVSKRRIFFNGFPNKITKLSEEKMEEVRIAVEFELGLEDLFFNEDKAYVLINQINSLKHNIKYKKAKELIDLYYEKLNEFKTYCKKYNKDYKIIYDNFKTFNLQSA